MTQTWKERFSKFCTEKKDLSQPGHEIEALNAMENFIESEISQAKEDVVREIERQCVGENFIATTEIGKGVNRERKRIRNVLQKFITKEK